MHYGIIGLGPIGAFFAGHLGAAGHKVSVLCRSPHRRDVFKKEKLKVSGKKNVETQLTDVYTEMGDFVDSGPDVILICTKSSESHTIVSQLKTLKIKPETVFVSCQNGIDVEEEVVEAFGSDKALRMILNLGCSFVKPTEVWVTFCFTQYLSSKKEAHPFDERIFQDLVNAGIEIEHVENYKEEAFKKAVLNSALGSICALTRMTMKQVMEEPELLRLVKELIRESIEVGLTQGYDIKEFLQPAVDYLSKGGDHKPSMLVDIENAKLTENENHCGKLFGFARAAGIEVPVIQTIYYLIKNLEKTAVINKYVTGGMK